MSQELQRCLHPELGELIHSYELGTLAEADALRFEDHLIDCAFCRAELAVAASLMVTLSTEREAVIAELQRTGDSFAGQWNRAKKSDGGSWLRRFLRSAYTRYALAPAVAVGIIAALFVLRKPPPPLYFEKIETQLPSNNSTLSQPEGAVSDTTEADRDQLSETHLQIPVIQSSVPPQKEPRVNATSETTTPELKAAEPKQERLQLAEPTRHVNESASATITETSDEAAPLLAEEVRIKSVPQTNPSVAGAPEAIDLREDLARATAKEKPAAKMMIAGDQPYQSIDPSGSPLPRFRISDSDKNQSTLQRASNQYGARDFPGALSSLEQARKLATQSAEPPFYWAVCRYVTAAAAASPDEALRSADTALHDAERLLAPADTLREWVNWYRAKIAMERGEDGQALMFLQKLEPATSPLREEAQRLRERLLTKTQPTKTK